VTKLATIISCLGCEQVKQESMMMMCGHNLCNECISKHSESYYKNSVKCEACFIETKVKNLEKSMPHS
jgi:hypothetical protein